MHVGQTDEKHIIHANDVEIISRRLSQSGEPELSIKLYDKAKYKWSMMTEKAATSSREPIHVIINNRVVTSPIVFDAIYSGSTAINGNFEEMEAIQIMKKINLGNLDYDFEIKSQRIIVNE